jgi:hypothetical protein
MTGFCEQGNEPSGSIKKARYFLQADYQLSNNVLHHGISK